MRRTILTASLLVILTLSLTQLATAQWKGNVFKNETSGAVFVAFTTYRPATSEVPLGWRTVAWYRIKAGQSHTFQAYQENPIYYLIIDQATGDRLLPEDAKSYTGWMYNKAFVIVSKDEPNTLTPAAELLYTTHARTSNLLLRDSNFFKSENTGSVTVTPTGVIAPLAEIKPPNTGGGTEDLKVWQATVTASVDGQTLNTTGTGSIQVATSSPIQITVQLKRNGVLTRGKLFFSVEGPTGATLDKREGTTDANAEVQALLTLSEKEGNYKFIVQVESDVLQDNPATQVDETAPIQLRELIFAATEGPGADAENIVVSGTKGVDPRGGSADGRISLTFKVTTPAGNPVINAPVGVAWLSGPAIERIPDQRPVTNSQGVTSIALRLAGKSTGNLRIRVSVGPVQVIHTIAVRHSLGSVSFVNGLPGSINSGGIDAIEVKVLSRNGTPMSGVSLNFSTTSSNLRFTRSSGTSSSSGRFSNTVQTKGKTSGYWSGSRNSTYNATGKEWIKVTASHTPSFGSRVTKTLEDWVRVMPLRLQRQTNSYTFGSRHEWNPLDLDWYWTGWTTVSLSQSACNEVLYWWGAADVSWVDDPFVDEENITNEDESSIKKTGARSWKLRVRIREHIVDRTTVKVSVKAYCEVIDGSFGAPSLPQLSLRPETHHLAETWQELSQVPSKTALLANYPNPFNPETWIPYHLSDPAEVTLSIYSAEGRLVRTLALGHQDAGIYESKSRAAYWDGRNSVGEHVASGLYFYTLTAGDFAATGKMLIMK